MLPVGPGVSHSLPPASVSLAGRTGILKTPSLGERVDRDSRFSSNDSKVVLNKYVLFFWFHPVTAHPRTRLTLGALFHSPSQPWSAPIWPGGRRLGAQQSKYNRVTVQMQLQDRLPYFPLNLDSRRPPAPPLHTDILSSRFHQPAFSLTLPPTLTITLLPAEALTQEPPVAEASLLVPS